MDDGEDGFEVGASGNFGNNTTVSGENVNLRDDDVAEDVDAVFDDGGGGFVARSFDGEDFHGTMIHYFGGFGKGWGARMG